MESCEVKISEVSSAYWETGDKGAESGRQRPEMRGLPRMLAAKTLDTKT